MFELPQKQLLEWKMRLEREIVDSEKTIKPLTDKLNDVREKLRAIESLISSNGGGVSTVKSNGGSGNSISTGRDQKGAFAPTGAYWLPILESLLELGGRSESDSVLNLVQKKMAGVLTPADLELLPSGISVRWRNRAQWQRKNMATIGLMREDSPRGIWEITDIGRQFVARNRGHVV